MKSLITVSIVPLAAAGAAILAVLGFQSLHPRIAHAQQGCSASSFNAPYSYNVTGTYYDNAGNVYAYGDAGTFTPDGNGNLTGSDTVSNDGAIGHRTFTGSYSVNANCSGSAKFQFSDGMNASMDLFLGNGGKSVNFIDTDNNVIVTGNATAQ